MNLKKNIIYKFIPSGQHIPGIKALIFRYRDISTIGIWYTGLSKDNFKGYKLVYWAIL